jgi:hypothetical protein
MKTSKVEVLEPNRFVLKYKDYVFRGSVIDYTTLLDKDTLREHERQMSRLNNLQQ